MIGDNSLVIEKTMANAACDEGILSQMPLPFPSDLMSWRASTNATMGTAGTAPYAGTISEGTLMVATWAYNASAGAKCSFIMPDEWADRQQDLVFYARARKYDAGADENNDLALKLTATWWKTSDLPSAPASQSVTSAALAAAGADDTKFADYKLDLGAALRAASKKIPRGATVLLTFGPHEQVGTNDMTLEVAGIYANLRRHVAMKTVENRKAK